MKLPQLYCLVLAFAALPSTALALTPSQIFDKVKDSVVVVKTVNEKGETISQGSGVLLPSGKIATNCHVVENGAQFQVGRGKRLVPATLSEGDEDKDICLLHADKFNGTPAELGKAGTLKVGEPVYAVGAPQGLELSLTDGIVSALRGGTPPLIQTTAAISHGSSGGGLFNSVGRLVGFTTLYIAEGQSLNFAMPVEWLSDIKPGKITSGAQRSQIDWLARAIVLEEKQDWGSLLKLGRLWADAEPESASAWFSIGSALQHLNHIAKAIDAYHLALSTNPENPGIWYTLGTAYTILDRHDDAIAAYRQALRINPEDDKAWNNLAVAYHLSGNTTAALKAVRALRLLDPARAEKLFNLIVPR